MTDSYTNFAQIYDELMDNVPYKEWCAYVRDILSAHGISDGLVLDLGCGTGTFTELLARAGYDMIGVDNSEDMLSVAMQKREASGLDILYLQQDMREFELYGTVRAIVSVCDSMNYLICPEDFEKVLKLAANYLDYNGVFLFDVNTPHKYAQILSDNTFAENREDCSFIWENDYDPDTCINTYALTMYVQDAGEQGTFRRFEEVHEQRAYSVDEIRKLVASSGLELLEVYDGFVKSEPRMDSERLCFLLRRPEPDREK